MEEAVTFSGNEMILREILNDNDSARGWYQKEGACTESEVTTEGTRELEARAVSAAVRGADWPRKVARKLGELESPQFHKLP